MASSRKRVRSPQTPSSCPDRDSFEDEDGARSAKKLTDVASSLHTSVDVKEEIDDEEEFSELQQSCWTPEQQQIRHSRLEKDDNIPQLSTSNFNSEIVEALDIPLNSTAYDATTNSSRFTATEDVKNIKLEPEPIPSSSSAFLPDYRPSSLLTFETSEDMQDETLPDPDPAPSSSTSPYFPLFSKVPTSVSLSFGFSDDEDDLPQSSEPNSLSLMTIPAPNFKSEPPEHADSTDLTPGADLNIIECDSKVEVPQTSSSTLVLAEKKEYLNTSETLHSELHLPVDVEGIKTEEDNTLESTFSSDGMFLDFIQGSKDAMFLEEVSMTVGQFNELLNNLLLYNCFQVPGLMNRMKLEAVLKFLVKGESIANLAQHYKIGKQTFSKFLPDVLNAIYGVLGLFRVKTGENRWAKVQKGFTERLNLPNCCGVINAKTIITWKPETSIHLPILTITDSEYNILSLDCTAAIEDQGIDFKTTRMYNEIHSTSELQIPHLGFLVGNEHLQVTRFVFPLYSTVSDDMPIPKLFNSRMERAFRISENTYSVLTSKFKVYDKIMSLTPSIGRVVVKATCALHNWLKQTSPGYITPGLLDEEMEDGVWKIGSCHYGSKQIFQPIHLFKAKKNFRKNSYARRRDLYAYSLFVLEQTKKSQSNS